MERFGGTAPARHGQNKAETLLRKATRLQRSGQTWSKRVTRRLREPLREPTMIEFFFDCSSPWTYLAFHNIQPLAEAFGETIVWRPILVGGVFNAVNRSVYENRANPVPQKARYMLKDLQDWARVAGLRIVMPPTVFPVNSVKAMRACIVLEPRGLLPAFARACFETYFGEDQDISKDEALAAISERVGVDFDELSANIAQQSVKEQLKANTDEVIRRGGFGSPTMFVDGGEMYFGNDRIPLVREALVRRA
jgi:2-hydroxychromene-2-carboxylate isomerase